MELKPNYNLYQSQMHECFNRTFMELKLNVVTGVYDFTLGFNRTFMELKLSSVHVRYTTQRVLIGPSWN